MISWKCKHTWKKSAVNTSWCLLGCSIGDFGTILYFQNIAHDWSTMSIMGLAMLNGLITSVLLETFILSKQMIFSQALRTALGMSFISMVAMEFAMNVTDILLTGGAQITWWAIPIMLTAGFLTPWPYNYWRLKKYNASCH
ncbi:MAG TPA: DUF4396 domain-containing protein [Candidatus Marinimicrobia bacterium]|nr:DUF4396 domain-containing protein [Candidatus Neomarinimicrobiota bacterium]|tara:strand:+ start:773 stop:1195 length:423 start_codon:yes stop_codon:yes gene_type:complete